MKQILFDNAMPRYKGNLHTHTTRSDGVRSPEEAIAAYREAGYDFLAITDHRLYTPGEELPGFTLLGGTELDCNDFKTRRAWHIIGLGITRPVPFEEGTPPEALARGIREAGGLAVLGHPAWSLLSPQDILSQPGCFATEIYSGISEAYGGRGDSSILCDIAAAQGYRGFLLGVDDAHFYDTDVFQSWIVLSSPSRKTGDLLESLRSGRFYASEGPDIRQVTIEDGVVTAETSPCERIGFFTDTFWKADRLTRGHALTTASCTLGPRDRYVRVECTDAAGKRATTQYFSLAGETAVV